jgi:hypothetical protein
MHLLQPRGQHTAFTNHMCILQRLSPEISRVPEVLHGLSDFLLQYSFGPWPISPDEVFAKTQLSYAFVNLKPIVPGKQLLAMLTCCCLGGHSCRWQPAAPSGHAHCP